MAVVLDLPDMRAGYVALAEYVVKNGRQTSPRGLPIVEVNDLTFTVADLTNTLPVGVGRDLNPVIAALEALQLIAEYSYPHLLVAVAPQFTNYAEPGEYLYQDDVKGPFFYGSYGRRIQGQVDEVIAKLTQDPDTRQAVITLWSPELDNLPNKRDYPCTVALGFRIRRGRLDASVLMRSNDVWLGVAYDVFQFTQLQWTIANELDVEPGTYTHTAWSMHVYDRDLPKIAKLHPPGGSHASIPHGLSTTSFGLASEVALELLTRPRRFEERVVPTAAERWYLDRALQAHRALEGSTWSG